MSDTTQNPTTAVAVQPAAILRPRVDVIESDDAFEVVAELPGVSEDGLEVLLEGDVLTLRGTPTWTPPEGYTLAHGEIAPGRFERTFRIAGEVDTDAIDAVLEHGLLRVRLPKAKPRRRQIDVKAG